MNVKDTLEAVMDAFKRIKHYAEQIGDSFDYDVQNIIIAICDQELKATQYDLEQYEVEQQQKGDK